MTTNSMNIGIVGPGRVANRLADAINHMPEFNLWSIYSRQIKNAEEFANQYAGIGSPSAYNDYNKMLKDENLHAVIISTPDNFHFHYAREALKQGKHVLIEKPLCTDLAEGRELMKQAKISNRTVAIGYHLRSHPGLRKIYECIKSGALGKIHHLSITWAHTFIDDAKWRKSTKDSEWWCQTALSTHCLDLVRWLMVHQCGEIVNIKCLTTNKIYNTNEETATISIECESGATATIYNSILFDTPFQIDIYGEKGKACGRKLTSSNESGTLLINNVPVTYPPVKNLYVSELENFYNAIQGRTDVEVSVKEGYRNIELLHSGTQKKRDNWYNYLCIGLK